MSRKSVPEKPIVVSTGGAAAVPARRKTAAPKRAARITEPEVRTSAVEPTQDQIARLAYSYWESRGCQGGSPEEDWLRAVQELRASAK